jgi:hypothetical protein
LDWRRHCTNREAIAHGKRQRKGGNGVAGLSDNIYGKRTAPKKGRLWQLHHHIATDRHSRLLDYRNRGQVLKYARSKAVAHSNNAA